MVTWCNQLYDLVAQVWLLGVASLPGSIPKMGVVVIGPLRVLFFYILDTFLGCLEIVPLRYQKQRFLGGLKRGMW